MAVHINDTRNDDIYDNLNQKNVKMKKYEYEDNIFRHYKRKIGLYDTFSTTF